MFCVFYADQMNRDTALISRNCSGWPHKPVALYRAEDSVDDRNVDFVRTRCRITRLGVDLEISGCVTMALTMVDEPSGCIAHHGRV